MQESIRTCLLLNEASCFKCGLYMFCVACMKCAHDSAIKCAMALLFISTRKKMQESIRTCVCNEVSCFEYGLYMFCVACMKFAHDSAMKCAMALLFMSTRKKMQESIRTCVCNEVSFLLNKDCICFV